eukprot:273461-Pelagomonas_calceolata.AAC.1
MTDRIEDNRTVNVTMAKCNGRHGYRRKCKAEAAVEVWTAKECRKNVRASQMASSHPYTQGETSCKARKHGVL